MPSLQSLFNFSKRFSFLSHRSQNQRKFVCTGTKCITEPSLVQLVNMLALLPACHWALGLENAFVFKRRSPPPFAYGPPKYFTLWERESLGIRDTAMLPPPQPGLESKADMGKRNYKLFKKFKKLLVHKHLLSLKEAGIPSESIRRPLFKKQPFHFSQDNNPPITMMSK